MCGRLLPTSIKLENTKSVHFFVVVPSDYGKGLVASVLGVEMRNVMLIFRSVPYASRPAIPSHSVIWAKFGVGKIGPIRIGIKCELVSVSVEQISFLISTCQQNCCFHQINPYLLAQ